MPSSAPFGASQHVKILGIVSKTHDTGLALIEDGVPALVLEEERFTRIKHSKAFPRNCLKAAFGDMGHTIAEVDAITIPWKGRRLMGTFMKAIAAKPPASLNLLRPSAHATHDMGIVNLWARMHVQLRGALGVTRLPPIHEVGHHDAHASVFFVSPFDEATVLVMDGYGDETATSAYIGRGNRIEPFMKLGFFDSLGMLYTCTTQHLGFKPFEEGTVMALAACGRGTYVDRFRDVVRLGENGSFTINRDYIDYPTHGLIRPFSQRFIDTFGPPRLPAEPLSERHMDVAFALQAVTEDVVLHIVRHLERSLPSRNLVITGGVGLNCVANARVLRDTAFERVWVPPCASDTGAPLGSALFHYHQTLDRPRTGYEMTHPFLGKAYSEADAIAALEAYGLAYERLPDDELFERVAHDLSEQKIVGWFQGRYEIGPRALGNRSILADPRSLKIKDLINARIKYREPFRPFAPAVLVERAAEFFEVGQPDPFMTMAPRVKTDKVDVIPAAVHVDGTGRIQTVRREDNPRYYRLIETFGRLTGVPVLINTSFNRQEPVVASPAEAVSCYLRTAMDVLVLGNVYVTARSAEAEARAARAFQVAKR
ncbi:MAG: carbamoyltransferase C-terminal domain-containing protein [Hyphomicrobiaceae bacterium]|nr:carbamoyltransferase C-terminal domain-containing protein [Hyphomicrobiaceae bacterium]